MQLMTGTWYGALISEDGGLETKFSLSQPGFPSGAIADARVTGPVMTINGYAAASVRLLDGARSALVALAEAVPDPASGSLAQVLLDVRMLGDRLVGHWQRRDANGVMLSGGKLVAVRSNVV
jgi:hypothetical protein